MSTADNAFRTLSEELVEAWGSQIASGRIPPGSRFSSEAVASDSHVSRGVVREAMRVLETLGMVTLRQRTGISIRPVEHWSPYDVRVLRWRLAGPERVELLRSLNEFMSAVEPLAACLAAGRATAADCRALSASVIGMAESSRAVDFESYCAHHIEFHTHLLSATENPMIERLVPTVDALVRARIEPGWLNTGGGDPQSVRLHGMVAAAIQRRDADGAASAMATVVSTGCGIASAYEKHADEPIDVRRLAPASTEAPTTVAEAVATGNG